MTTTIGEDQIEIRDVLVARGVMEPKASELAVVPGMCVELVLDAFKRANPKTQPIAIAKNLEGRAAARKRVLDRDGTAETVASEEQRRIDRHAALVHHIVQETTAREQFLEAVPEDKLKESIAAVKKKHSWIIGEDPKENTMLAVLVVDQMRAAGLDPGSLYG